MIEAVVFDMDGLLIDSEPFWRAAEVSVFNQLGFPLTEEMCEQTVGFRIDEVVRYWHDKHPWPELNVEKTASDIVSRVKELVHESGVAKPGVYELLEFFEQKKIQENDPIDVNVNYRILSLCDEG